MTPIGNISTPLRRELPSDRPVLTLLTCSVNCGGAPRRGVAIAYCTCLTLLCCAILAFAFLPYLMPTCYASLMWGHDPPGALQWERHFFGHSLTPASTELYRTSFRSLVIAVWFLYASVTALALRMQGVPIKPIVVSACMLSVAIAIFAPPALATDVYAYIGYARMFSEYGQNPYTVLPSFLFHVQDSVAPYLVWNLPTVYGPVWTLFSATLTAVLHAQSLWTQAVTMKLAEAVGLVVAAFAGRSVAEQICPERGNITFLAIAFNPLLLIEGPANGHNDILLMALLLCAASASLQERHNVSSLLLGLSIGIKFITIAAVPLLLISALRNTPRRFRLWNATALGALSLAPSMLSFVPFWSGVSTWTGISERMHFGESHSALVAELNNRQWLHTIGFPDGLGALLVSCGRQWPMIVLYCTLTLWHLCQREVTWTRTWTLCACGLIVLTMGVPYPWYLIWIWATCLTRWNRFDIGLTTATLAVSAYSQWLYVRWVLV